MSRRVRPARPDGRRAIGTGALSHVIARGVVVLRELRRRYEPRLWRDEASAQIKRLLTGTRAGTVDGRDHDGVPPRCYRSKSRGSRLWLRPGTGDAAVWGEVNIRGLYEPPWPISPDCRVLDLGGHGGYFALWALVNWPISSLVSVEPDPANADLLARNAEAAADPRWSLVHAAAHTAAGTAAFAGGRGSGSSLRDEGDELVETIDALPLLAECDFAKIDIEGAEWTLLADERFDRSGPPMLVLEYHPRAGMADPAGEARRRLESFGYDVRAPHPEEVPGVGVLWARRPA
jgi:FkbM family methyltransferase